MLGHNLEQAACTHLYRSGEIESTVMTSLLIPPTTATSYRDFLALRRTSSAAFAFPAESNSMLRPSGVTIANDFVFARGWQ